jgi:hypothetical protein
MQKYNLQKHPYNLPKLKWTNWIMNQ